mmetsp:Transcript_102642/g.331196  ORF Transcript_102642/g.331196 Transcript_102642/m.331196 type:complete len:215 (+) Transcript_102642:835-1479(+)
MPRGKLRLVLLKPALSGKNPSIASCAATAATLPPSSAMGGWSGCCGGGIGVFVPSKPRCNRSLDASPLSGEALPDEGPLGGPSGHRLKSACISFARWTACCASRLKCACRARILCNAWADCAAARLFACSNAWTCLASESFCCCNICISSGWLMKAPIGAATNHGDNTSSRAGKASQAGDSLGLAVPSPESFVGGVVCSIRLRPSPVSGLMVVG